MKLMKYFLAVLMAVTVFAVIPVTVMAQDTPTTTAPASTTTTTTVTTETPAGTTPTTSTPATTTTATPQIVKVDVSSTYPTVEVQSGDTAIFEVKLSFTDTNTNSKPKLFDLNVSTPKDWTYFITPQYPTDKKIASIQLDPMNAATGSVIEVNVVPPVYVKPDPGDYPVTLNVVGPGDLQDSMNLTVKVKAKYALSLEPSGELYNMTATAGKDNSFAVKLVNTGSDPINTIAFSADKPTDWAVDFPNNGKIDTIAAGSTQTLDINVKPPSKAIAGDYQITLKTTGKEANAADLVLRVTVETPTLWGIVGIIIIALAIGGISLAFMRFSRR